MFFTNGSKNVGIFTPISLMFSKILISSLHTIQIATTQATRNVNGTAYRVTVAYGAVDPAELNGNAPASNATVPAGEGNDVLSPLEGKFFLVKNALRSR